MEKFGFNVFNGFKCLAGSCKHSCCVGWQIDLDCKTAKLYKRLSKKQTPLKERFAKCVDYSAKTMILNNRRCPFLNEKNLCDIIVCEGENSISQTCKLHPRFINVLSAKVEMGYGLSCQKALSMLFDFNGKLNLNPLDEQTLLPKNLTRKNRRFNGKLDEKILEFRKEVLEVLQDDKIPFLERIKILFKKVDLRLVAKDVLEYAKFLLTLDRLDQSWTEILNKFIENFPQKTTSKKLADIPQNVALILENLTCYFIYRHLPDAIDKTDLNTRLSFALTSTVLIYATAYFLNGENGEISANIYDENDQNPYSLFEIIRNYSAEIEYSFDNFYHCLDHLESLKITKKLKGY